MSVTIAISSVSPDTTAFFPRVIIEVKFIGMVNADFLLSPFDVQMKEGQSWRVIGTAFPKASTRYVGSGENIITYFMELTHEKLERIERSRSSGDLLLRAPVIQAMQMVKRKEGNITHFRELQPVRQSSDYRIPKSDWAEDFLAAFRYKFVRVIEIPAIVEDKEGPVRELAQHLHDAWKDYSAGEYSKALVSSRKAVEIIEQNIKNAGFKKKPKGKTRYVADWRGFLESRIGDHVREAANGIWGMTSMGAHHGRHASRTEAEFSLMTTHGLASLYLARVRATEDNP